MLARQRESSLPCHKLSLTSAIRCDTVRIMSSHPLVTDHPDRPRPSDRNRGRSGFNDEDVALAVALGWFPIVDLDDGFIFEWVDPVGVRVPQETPGILPSDLALSLSQHRANWKGMK